MRIVVHGQQAFGKSVLEALLERGDNVIAAYCAPEKGGRIDPLREAAELKSLPVYQPTSYRNKPEVWEAFAALKPDLCIMAYVTLFVPEEMLNIPTYGTIQYHPSLLPAHRGPSSINWPIAMGKTRTGLTIFWPNEGLDEGPVLIQKSVEIGPDDTLGDVYFKKLFPMGVDAMIEGLELVRAGAVLKHAQNLAHGSYESWFKKDLAEIDWAKPAAEIYNLIRAVNPAPGAWSTMKGQKVDIFDSAKVAGSGTPGAVLAIDDQGMTIAAGGGAILAKRVRGADGKKVAAAEWARSAGVQSGDGFEKPAAPKSTT